ncbi:meiotic recombination protein [Schizosaccharomyces octosporus yFS286]|uniref:Meiotic recombination protein n=1 Tax=Schizosaccharomyces octosporus (strain yFS286) TaxID=483514 RepID=S9PS90_SCHOY|nr:meiotic recombination protein [Schizosaccharomyces octosporus yFS286]EPX70862.1 meiotic recombination protein [Schizosaccharomyces octosporus yFS286]
MSEAALENNFVYAAVKTPVFMDTKTIHKQTIKSTRDSSPDMSVQVEEALTPDVNQSTMPYGGVNSAEKSQTGENDEQTNVGEQNVANLVDQKEHENDSLVEKSESVNVQNQETTEQVGEDEHSVDDDHSQSFVEHGSDEEDGESKDLSGFTDVTENKPVATKTEERTNAAPSNDVLDFEWISKGLVLFPDSSVCSFVDNNDGNTFIYSTSDDLNENTLEDLFGIVRARLESLDALGSDSELVCEFSDLNLKIAEDNVYANQIHLVDILELLSVHCSHGKSFSVLFTTQPRFIARYNKLVQDVSSASVSELELEEDDTQDSALVPEPSKESEKGVAPDSTTDDYNNASKDVLGEGEALPNNSNSENTSLSGTERIAVEEQSGIDVSDPTAEQLDDNALASILEDINNNGEVVSSATPFESFLDEEQVKLDVINESQTQNGKRRLDDYDNLLNEDLVDDGGDEAQITSPKKSKLVTSSEAS